MNLWSVEHFLAIFVVTFGRVQQQTAANWPKKWWQKRPRNVQLILGSFGKEMLHTYKIHTLMASLMSPCWIRSSFLPPKGGFNTGLITLFLFFSGFGECGANAECEAVDHAATCKCPEGTRELNSPYVACVPSDLDLSTISCLRDSDCSFGLTCQSWQCRPS